MRGRTADGLSSRRNLQTPRYARREEAQDLPTGEPMGALFVSPRTPSLSLITLRVTTGRQRLQEESARNDVPILPHRWIFPRQGYRPREGWSRGQAAQLCHSKVCPSSAHQERKEGSVWHSYSRPLRFAYHRQESSTYQDRSLGGCEGVLRCVAALSSNRQSTSTDSFPFHSHRLRPQRCTYLALHSSPPLLTTARDSRDV